MEYKNSAETIKYEIAWLFWCSSKVYRSQKSTYHTSFPILVGFCEVWLFWVFWLRIDQDWRVGAFGSFTRPYSGQERHHANSRRLLIWFLTLLALLQGIAGRFSSHNGTKFWRFNGCKSRAYRGYKMTGCRGFLAPYPILFEKVVLKQP